MNPNIPADMRTELFAGVKFIITMANRYQTLDSVLKDVFEENLCMILCLKYRGHWFPNNPMRERDYRCICSEWNKEDDSLLDACMQSGIQYKHLAFPKVFCIWIDPYEVSCRLGGTTSPFIVDTFDPHVERKPRTVAPQYGVEARTNMPSYTWIPSQQGMWWTPIAEPETRIPGFFRTWTPLWFPR
ncbi:protein BTG4-like isoform X2 [Hyperolius riggenbachi]|uniref:protein BTG4-like isoform X2 n=1 Tax=Hyperolius riggenbachi TaxID=752182 RepID=UPI0035A37974